MFPYKPNFNFKKDLTMMALILDQREGTKTEQNKEDPKNIHCLFGERHPLFELVTSRMVEPTKFDKGSFLRKTIVLLTFSAPRFECLLIQQRKTVKMEE